MCESRYTRPSRASQAIAAGRARPRLARAVTTTLTQKTGASVQTASSQYWDVGNDNYVAYKYENDQMQALTTVYGIAI
jgi:hypothetical protein